ncbi:MAG: UDP-N-acetylmuramoyl-L-alanyl-D-glutamate--2,6-diaminopimelate ligase [Clostridium sp.]|nr:UDP-N-acetylmuramoyl-L-alanyl-D-glutamate--2,6-diaminopimelate ligase [Clostridium sp.]
MNLKKLLNGISYDVLNGNDGIEINEIQYDSRKVKENDVFVCIEGFKTDGHNYVQNAVKSGAKVIVCSRDLKDMPKVTVVKVKDSRKTLAKASTNFYDHPEKKLNMIGITGTNGKTTSAFMIKSILESSGKKAGLIGTIANYIGTKKLHSERTTPESLELFQLLNEMVEEDVKYCVMETSSHSLYLSRVYGITFNEGIFTNLTQDHLDFHKTFENYYKAKLILFKNSKNSVINMDDKYGNRVYDDVSSNKITYGIDEKVDLRALNIKLHSRGASFDLSYKNETARVNINIPGRYNISNALGSAGACLLEGLSLNDIKNGLEALKAVPGRCEPVETDKNLGFDIIIDYAHTPDGLVNILKTAKEFTSGRLITVFGCGGDRDKTKRPIMGEVAAKMSDVAVVTSDNPRTEEPMSIIKDVLEGIKSKNDIVIENRKEAIKKAISIAKKGDVIVIAGKGHEDYQILKSGKIHFDEREIVAEIIKELF